MKFKFLHQPYEPYAYAVTKTTARIILLADKGGARQITLHYGDRYEQKLEQSLFMEFVGFDGTYDVFQANVPIDTSRLKYRFEIQMKRKAASLWYGESGAHEDPDRAGVFQLAYLCPRDIYEVPDWTKSAVCYQIFPERFCNGDERLTPANAESWDAAPTPRNMLGGDLPGIRQRLGYLQDLGINLIYLTPIFQAGSNHKYDTYDYFEIDKQFGTKEDLRLLVEDAHAKGIRVVLDAVFNHSGPKFAPFQDVLDNGKASKYWDWFFIEGDTADMENVNYETFATKNAYMPKLNVANPEVENYLLEVGSYWIREFDIDGWRLDVANEIDHVFWRKFRNTVKGIKPDALIIGEVWHNSLPWLRGDQFDGVMNYLFREYGLSFLVDGKMSGVEFGEQLIRLMTTYPHPAAQSQFNLLGSHDTERILTHAGGNKQAVLRAMTYMFTFPGIPMVYYGDEIGMEGNNDPGCRAGMVWDEDRQDRTLRAAIQQLANLKHELPALYGTELRIVRATDGAIEYKRVAGDGTSIHVALNAGDQPFALSCGGNVLFESDNASVVDGQLGRGHSVVWVPATKQRTSRTRDRSRG